MLMEMKLGKAKARGDYMLQTWLKILTSLVVISLSACVTTETGKLGANADPAKAEASYVQLGLAYLQNGNRDSSRLNFENALELNKRSAPAHEGIARLYQLEAENELAEKHFRLALRYDPEFSRAHNNYGYFLFLHDRYEEAYKEIDKAARDVSYESRGVALLNLGKTALKLGNQERARAAFEHALSVQPNLTPVFVELADISYEMGDYALAKSYLDRHLSVAKPTPRILWLGIRLERKFGNTDKERSYAIQLKNLYEYSQENLDYQKWVEANP